MVNHKIMLRLSTCMRGEIRDAPSTSKDTFIHYCQRYHMFETRNETKYLVNNAQEFLPALAKSAGQSKYVYSFSKYWLAARGHQKWLIDCPSPLLLEPPVPSRQQFSQVRTSCLVHLSSLVKVLQYYEISCGCTRQINRSDKSSTGTV